MTGQKLNTEAAHHTGFPDAIGHCQWEVRWAVHRHAAESATKQDVLSEASWNEF
jgi:hypothetical protein